MTELSRWLAMAMALALCVLGGACGSSSEQGRTPTTPKRALRSMPEARALELIDGWLTEAAWIGRPGWIVPLAEHADLEVDLRLGGSRFGVEWVSGADRERYGSALPAPAPAGQLRLFTSPDGSQVLILDHEVYRSAREGTLDRTLVLSDSELRLRRDVLSFLAHVASQ